MVAWIKEMVASTLEADDKPTVKGSRTLRCKLTNRDDALGLVLQHPDCPKLRSSFDVDNPRVLCRSVKVERDTLTGDGGIMVQIQADYSTESENNSDDEESQDPDPTQRPAELRLSFDRFEEPFYQAKANPTAELSDGTPVDITSAVDYNVRANAVVASNGNPFDPGLLTSVVDLCYTFSKNVASVDLEPLFRRIAAFTNCVNEKQFRIAYRGSFFTFPPATMWLYGGSSEPGNEGGVPFEAVSLVFRFRRDGWLRKVLDMAMNPWPQDDHPSGKSPPYWLDAYGEPVSTPEMLNGKGTAIRALTPLGRPTFLKFQEFDKVDFRRFGFSEIF